MDRYESVIDPSCFNDYRRAALTSTILKCFERLVMQQVPSILPPFVDPFQFAYWTNRSKEDAASSALHSVFYAIIPQQLMWKLDRLGLSTSLCTGLSHQEMTSRGQQQHIEHHHILTSTTDTTH